MVEPAARGAAESVGSPPGSAAALAASADWKPHANTQNEKALLIALQFYGRGKAWSYD